jgi:tetratricopeptide (TPR) repeat protein
MDPLSAQAHAAMAMSLYFARQHERAVECLNAAVELDPRFADAHCGLGLNYQQLGRWDRAFTEFEEALALSGRSVEDVASLGVAYAAAGRTREAHAMLAELDGLTAHRYVPPVYFAAIHAGLGDEAAAFEWLERAFADRSSWLVFLRVEPWWDRLRANARFELLLQRMRL